MKCLIRLVICVAAAAAPALAVSTSYWTQTSESDFKSGTLDNVVATNLGELKLSRALKILLEEDPRINAVNALAEAPDGSIYAGTGPGGVLLRLKDGKVSDAAVIENATNIFALSINKAGRVLVGTGGDAGKVYSIAKPGDKPREIFKAASVQYVWALAETPDGMIYAATGPNGQLYEVKPDGTNRVLLESGENNILSLISDGDSTLYAGTDPHGLVYRVNRKTGESFVLYNAPEAEVSSLAIDQQGNLYAGTAEAREEPTPPAGQSPTEKDKSGRPEGGDTGVPIPSERPDNPKPVPPPPNPNPSEPSPIPKHASPEALAPRADRMPRIAALTQWNRHSVSSLPRNPSSHDGMAHVVLALDNADGDPGDPQQPPDDNPRPKHKPHPPTPGPSPSPGKPQPPTPPQQQPPDAAAPDAVPGAAAPAHQPPVDTTGTGEPRPEGNAIYKIDRDGFVREIFRGPVLILSMVQNGGKLLIATGSEGQIYQVDPTAEETVALAKVDAKQVLCLLPLHTGEVYLGMANTGSIASMSPGFAAKGAYISPVLDATQISRFGKLQLHGTLPAGSSLKVATRSGNVKDADAKGWSNWADDVPATEFLQVESPSARFLQYRLSFTSGEGKSTPVVEDVSVAYQVPNLPPQIKAIKVGSAGSAADAVKGDAAAGGAATPDPDLRRVPSSRQQTIAWEASDPNNDALEYSLYFRQSSTEPWILLKDKLRETTYDWDTRTVADGRYVLKVVASDANANPPGQGKTASRVSDPVLVDNTPPVIGGLKWEQRGAGVSFSLNAVDRTSTVAAVDYSVDSEKDWQLVLPVDKIYDSPEETVEFVLPGLSPGAHQVTLRATDAKGNQAFENVFVTVQPPAASR